MCKIIIDNVQITLTKEQLEQIDNQRNKGLISHYTHIKTIEDAANVIAYKYSVKPLEVREKIKIICKAFNKLSKETDVFPNFKDNNQKKYYLYFSLDSGGLRFFTSDYICHGFHGTAGFTRTQEEANYLGNTFLHLYQELANETY